MNPQDRIRSAVDSVMGETERTIKLTPGPHTLQIVLGDYAHIPHDPPVMSERITVTVE